MICQPNEQAIPSNKRCYCVLFYNDTLSLADQGGPMVVAAALNVSATDGLSEVHVRLADVLAGVSCEGGRIASLSLPATPLSMRLDQGPALVSVVALLEVSEDEAEFAGALLANYTSLSNASCTVEGFPSHSGGSLVSRILAGFSATFSAVEGDGSVQSDLGSLGLVEVDATTAPALGSVSFNVESLPFGLTEIETLLPDMTIVSDCYRHGSVGELVIGGFRQTVSASELPASVSLVAALTLSDAEVLSAGQVMSDLTTGELSACEVRGKAAGEGAPVLERVLSHWRMQESRQLDVTGAGDLGADGTRMENLVHNVSLADGGLGWADVEVHVGSLNVAFDLALHVPALSINATVASVSVEAFTLTGAESLATLTVAVDEAQSRTIGHKIIRVSEGYNVTTGLRGSAPGGDYMSRVLDKWSHYALVAANGNGSYSLHHSVAEFGPESTEAAVDPAIDVTQLLWDLGVAIESSSASHVTLSGSHADGLAVDIPFDVYTGGLNISVEYNAAHVLDVSTSALDLVPGVSSALNFSVTALTVESATALPEFVSSMFFGSDDTELSVSLALGRSELVVPLVVPPSSGGATSDFVSCVESVNLDVDITSIFLSQCVAEMTVFVGFKNTLPFEITVDELKFDLFYDNPAGALGYIPAAYGLFLDQVDEPAVGNADNNLPLSLAPRAEGEGTTFTISTAGLADANTHCFRLRQQYQIEESMPIEIRDGHIEVTLGAFSIYADGFTMERTVSPNDEGCDLAD